MRKSTTNPKFFGSEYMWKCGERPVLANGAHGIFTDCGPLQFNLADLMTVALLPIDRKFNLDRVTMTNDMLIMDLTLEQGAPRETQVQPPAGAWHRYFAVPVTKGSRWSRVFTFRNRRAGGSTEVRRISSHDHNWTIELNGARPPRPAIIRIDRIRRSRFDYWVYRPDDPEFAHCDWLLRTVRNPWQHKGRRWITV